MNPWLWRLGLVAGAGAASFGLRQLYARTRTAVHRPRSCDHLFGATLTIMGHRGAAAVAPENTMVAFGVAGRLGVPFETDVRLCGTGEPVVIHDATLNRTTDGGGLVVETPWSTIRSLDAGAHFGSTFAGARVPLLDTVLATFGGEVPINLELKTSRVEGAAARLVEAVVELLHAHELVERVIVTSFDPLVLKAVREVDDRIVRGQILAPPSSSGFEEISQPDMLMIHHELATSPYVSRMKSAGYRVFVWTVNDEHLARRLVAVGVDGLITDDPARLRRALAAAETTTRDGEPHKP